VYSRVEGVSLKICVGIVIDYKSGIVGVFGGRVNVGGGGQPQGNHVGEERGEE